MKVNVKSYLKLIVLVLFVMIGFIAIRVIGFENISPENIKQYVLSFGVYSPIIFILIYILRSVLFFPASIFSIAGGLAFGSVWGTIYVVIGASLGAYLSFFLSRKLGKEAIQKWIGKRIMGTQLNTEIGFRAILILRLIPLFPFDGVSYVSGFTNVPFWKYALATTIGIIPGTFTYNYLGHSLNEPFSSTFFIAIALLLLLMLIPTLYKKFKKRRTNDE